MKTQLKTIRAGLEASTCYTMLGFDAHSVQTALTALYQLEAMVGAQEPVAWAMPKGDGTFIDVITPAEHARDEGSYTVPLFAHPVAQQPLITVEDSLRFRLDCTKEQLEAAEQECAELRAKLKAQQPQAEAVPSDVVCEKDPMGCWNVRCQLGKVCKNAAMKQGNQP